MVHEAWIEGLPTSFYLTVLAFVRSDVVWSVAGCATGFAYQLRSSLLVNFLVFGPGVFGKRYFACVAPDFCFAIIAHQLGRRASVKICDVLLVEFE